jgi:hypothetical protein
VSTNSAPNSPNVARPTEPTAAENLRRRKNPRFSIGCELARSQSTNAVMTARPPMPAAIVTGEDQPRTGASIKDHSNRPRPPMDSSAPAKSGRSAAGFFDSGISGSAHAAPTTAIGTLIRNTDPHQKWASSSPPMIGPSETPRPVVPAHRPMARCRSAGSRNTAVMMARVEGIIIAPPTPMLARAAISRPTEPENAAQAEPAANAARPARNTRLRPIRSARLPMTRSRPAKTTT